MNCKETSLEENSIPTLNGFFFILKYEKFLKVNIKSWQVSSSSPLSSEWQHQATAKCRWGGGRTWTDARDYWPVIFPSDDRNRSPKEKE
jgi:hypothetical protein